MRWLPCAAALSLGFVATTAFAQTVADEAGKHACDTSGVVGLSDQLVKVQMCLSPGTFVDFTPHSNVTLASSSVKPYLLATARDALWAASGSLDLQVTSAFRTLADQYVLYYSGACALAATPGNSNHETGKAVDLANWSSAVSAMTAAGCTHTYPSSDPVHFDCPGADHRADSIQAFQHLWNVNNPGDKIAEDGAYGPETEARLAKSPATGFADPADCTAPTTPDWAGQFVDQSFPKAGSGGVLTMNVGDAVSGWIEMKNVGGKAWDGKTFLGTTVPRDRTSPFAGSDWTAANRPVGVGGVVSPGGTHKFTFTLHAPSKAGDYDEHFGMVEEGVAWFSDKGEGGPADDLLEIKIKVVEADAGVGDGGTRDGGAHDAAVGDASSSDASDESGVGDDESTTGAGAGCGCRASGGTKTDAPALAAFGALLFVLTRAREKRNVRKQRPRRTVK